MLNVKGMGMGGVSHPVPGGYRRSQPSERQGWTTRGTIVSTDVLDVTLQGCIANNNTVIGAHLETTSTHEIRPGLLEVATPTMRFVTIALVRCRDLFLGGGLISASGGTAGINRRIPTFERFWTPSFFAVKWASRSPRALPV